MKRLFEIIFWATWCVPCLQSFPEMNRLVKDYEENKDVAFLFINTWETAPNFKENVNKIITSNQYDFKVLFDEQKGENDSMVVKQFGVEALPTKVIIDKKGMIRFRIKGTTSDAESSMTELVAMIEMLRKKA